MENPFRTVFTPHRGSFFSLWAILASMALALPSAPAPGPEEGPKRDAPALWAAPEGEGAPPLLLGPAEHAKPLRTDTTLWSPDEGLLWRQAAGQLPRLPSKTRTLTLRVVDEAGNPLPFARLQGRFSGGTFLPEPLGRWQAGADGKAVVRIPAESRLEVWTDGPAWLPIPVEVSPQSASAEVPAVAEREAVVCVEDAYGRILPSARFLTLPADSFADPLKQIADLERIRRPFPADPFGRIRIPRGPSLAGVVSAPNFRYRVLSLSQSSPPRSLRLEKSEPIELRLTSAEEGKVLSEGRWTVEATPPDLPWLVVEERGSLAGGRGFPAPPGYPARLTVQAPGRIPKTIPLDQRPSQPLSISLERGVSLEGKVVDENGTAVAEAEVCLSWDSCVKTGEDGRFILPPCAPQTAFDLTVSAEGFRLAEVTLSEKEIRERPIVLSRGGTLAGTVLDAQSGQPLSKAGVRLEALERVRSHSYSLEAETSDEGTFRFSGLDPAVYRLKAWAVGYNPAEETESLEGEGAPAEEEVTLTLRQGKGLSGRVLREAGGEGAPGTSVRLERALTFRDFPAKAGALSYDAETDSEGRYAFFGVEPGRYRLEAAGPSGTAALEDLAVSEDQTSLPDLVLKESARLSGTVATRSPSPDGLSGLRLSLMTQTFDLHPRTTVTDGEGAFAFEDLPPGSYRLACYRPLSAVPAFTMGVELTPGEDRRVTLPLDGVKATFQVEVAGRPASGGVLSVAPRTGAAFDAGIVSIQTPMGRVLLGLPNGAVRGEVDGAGMVTLEGLSPEPSMASLSWQGMRFTLPVAVPDPPPPLLPLRFQGSAIEGRVTTADGSPASGVSVVFSYEGIGVQPGWGTVTDGEGHFRFEGLGGGTVTVRAAASPSGPSAETRVDLPQDRPERVEVTLRLPPAP